MDWQMAKSDEDSDSCSDDESNDKDDLAKYEGNYRCSPNTSSHRTIHYISSNENMRTANTSLLNNSDSCSNYWKFPHYLCSRYIVHLDIPDYTNQTDDQTADDPTDDRVRFSLRPETHNGMASNTER